MTKEEILKEIDLAEAHNPGCTCGSYQCYECHLTGQAEDYIADLKQQLEDLEKEQKCQS